MPRKPRIHYEGALYHVIVRGNNKSYIFDNENDKLEYLKRVKKYKEKYKSKIYAFVIMDNHVHLLMEVSKTPLSKIMQLIQQTYTQYYNKKYNRTGHVFEQRYKAILCNKDEYLLALIRYIHKNPVKSNSSDINYKWSSHQEYLGNNLGICDVDFLLSMFSSHRELAEKKYLEYVMDKDIEIDEIMNYELILEEDIKIDNTDKVKIEKKNIDDIITEIERDYKINIEDIKGRARSRYISKIKQYFVREILKYRLMSQKELAEYLEITEMAVSKIANKV
jgi:REP element-mobilizing transposase RayT